MPRFAGQAPDGMVSVLAVHDDGAGPALYAAGSFFHGGETPAGMIARWQGGRWWPLGEGLVTKGLPFAMTTFDDGSGPALYVGGDFGTAGGKPALRIARWKDGQWSALGSGTDASVADAVVHDDGTGRALYVAGWFRRAGGIDAPGVARWDGTRWSSLGAGMGGPQGISSVRSLAVYDDGTGPALYAGGDFSTAGGEPAAGVARWKDGRWSEVGGGVHHPERNLQLVRGLAVFDDGGGEALYATGMFTDAGGVPAAGVARWDGRSWSGLGPGLGFDGGYYTGRRFAVFDDGSGKALYLVGAFHRVSGVEACYVARWDGAAWSAPPGGGADGEVFAMVPFDEGDGPALFVGGVFTFAGGLRSPRIAKLAGAPGRGARPRP